MHFYQKIRFSDLDLFLEQTKSWNLDFRQLDGGSFSGTLIQYGISNAQIGIGSFNRKFDQRGGAPAGHISFALLEQESPPIIWRGAEVDQNTVMVYRPGDEIDCSSEPGFKVITYSISEQSFLEHCHLQGFQKLVKILRHQRIFPIRLLDKQKLLETVTRVNRMVSRSCEEFEKETIKDVLGFRIAHLFMRAIAASADTEIKSPITDRSEKALRVIENNLKYASPPPAKV